VRRRIFLNAKHELVFEALDVVPLSWSLVLVELGAAAGGVC
jgi:hypothetical protein